MRFDLTDLRLFLHVAEARSITAGAAQANMALASASERIRGMEAALGIALLERRPRGVLPTPAGRALARHAQAVLRHIGVMQRDLAEYATGAKGHVRLLANTSALHAFLPEALKPFLTRHPAIDVELEERSSADIVRAVAEGDADLGVAADIVDFAGLEILPFATDELVVITPPGHPLAARRSLRFRETLAYPFVGQNRTSALQRHLEGNALQCGRPLALRARLGGFDAICRLVGEGIGVAVVPKAAAARGRGAASIRRLRLDDGWALRRLAVCMRSQAELPAFARQLAQHLGRQDRRAKPVCQDGSNR